VLVSANGGVTFYTGNAPGADVHGTQRPPGTTGAVGTQREEVTRVANQISGLSMDAVEADGWWARRAVEARLDDPLGTLKLLVRRAALFVSNAELSLAFAPAMDPNPLRWAAPYPACFLFGFAVGGVAALGWRRTGGFPVWLAIAACAVTPILFYVSSRYRVPALALLCLPAGAGLSALAGGATRATPWRRRLGILLGVLATAASLLVPVERGREGDVQALLERSLAYRAKGDLTSAERELRDALERDRSSTRAWVALADLLVAAGRPADAEHALERALLIRPGLPEAAGPLGVLLLEQGRPAEAVPLLKQFIAGNPSHAIGWNSLIRALRDAGDEQAAVRAAELATERGIPVDATTRTD
jgi:tetratricopeptide (TPR) repeat protein